MDSQSASDPVLTVTPAALGIVLDALAEEGDPERLALWVEITGAHDGAYTYDIYFQARADAARGDAAYETDGLAVVVPQASVARLRGARLDWSDEGEGGLVMLNPNTPPRSETPAVVPPNADLTSELAQRIISVLESDVNPSIAAHGGRADLVAVEEGTAYLRLSGGCQGCGLARVTLSQGIEVALRDAVPELVGVVDVTDHASGSNPYFESAKK
ncbi:MAG TPA: NifU family protein [Acidimicrobiales bacterium]|nr:NifU family protein [Acidimicrobiales bacterium]